MADDLLIIERHIELSLILQKLLSYPLIKKGEEHFKRDVIGFVQQLLRLLCKDPLLRSDSFLKTISDFLMVCTDSKVRAFRHTSTLIGM